MSFGNLRMFVHLMREEDQKEVIQSMYLPFFREAMSYDQLRQFFFETLELIRKFRNRSAHGGRIYNYSPNVSITFQPSFHSLIGISKAKYSKRKLGRNDLITLLGAFKVFNNQDPYNRLMISILSQLNSLFKVEPTLKNKIILAMNLPENYEQMIRIENSKPWNPKYLWEE